MSSFSDSPSGGSTGNMNAPPSAAATTTTPASASISSTASQPQPPHPKRHRVLLSCSACRSSKLKCDRASPCGQCVKRGRSAEQCVYAPRPERPKKHPKSMAARLKRLEGLVRGMLDAEGDGAEMKGGGGGEREEDKVLKAPGRVVREGKTMNYVGGTHFMAVLEDIDELKSFFEDSDQEEDSRNTQDPYESQAGSPEMLILSKQQPRTKEDLLAMLPEKSVVDRLMMRYFNSNSPSQHILHKPSFARQYNQFWRDPSKASLHWIALLFMIMSLGIFFSSFQAPHELQGDSPIPAMDRFRQYRSAASWALVWGKYSEPGPATLQAFLLYVETVFLLNRQSQMSCYLLCSVLIRMMLKMGLHRDPSKLPNISPFDGEMRRRLWNLAIQIDLLVSFHLGLPAMIHGIESDTVLPLHLADTDFDEDSKELPPPRPSSDYTTMTYAVNKAALCRVFGMVTRQAHSLTVPSYADVMKVEALNEETWKQVPSFMKLKPIEESITDPAIQVIQRFGLAAIYQKSRCVLHRRYLTDPIPKRQHAYSRRACLDAAEGLLDYQYLIYEACKPGAMLSQTGWFVSSMAMNDVLLADMIVALAIQSEHYPEIDNDGVGLAEEQTRTKDELLQMLRRSLSIWNRMEVSNSDCKKAAQVVTIMLRKAEIQLGLTPTTTSSFESPQSGAEAEHRPGMTMDRSGSIIGSRNGGPTNPSDAVRADAAQSVTQGETMTDYSWMGIPTGSVSYNWNQFDAITGGGAGSTEQPVTQPVVQGQQPSWLDKDPLDDLDFLTSAWNTASRR